MERIGLLEASHGIVGHFHLKPLPAQAEFHEFTEGPIIFNKEQCNRHFYLLRELAAKSRSEKDYHLAPKFE
jgi:hypothetical protein